MNMLILPRLRTLLGNRPRAAALIGCLSNEQIDALPAVSENPDDVGYFMRHDPLLDVAPAEVWREIEEAALR